MRSAVVIGAGIGGLTAAALLLKSGWRVTVLEAATYPGGCAGTFFYQNYRFDAGATIAGGFDPLGPHTRLGQILGLEWPLYPAGETAWNVHLNGRVIHQWVAPGKWKAEMDQAFPHSAGFWRLQEKLAAITWGLASRNLPWPPATLREALRLPVSFRPDSLSAAAYVARSMRSILPAAERPDFKTFIDAQLLISAQTVSDDANALYAATVLDLPRRGVKVVRGGMGAIADTLVDWIRRSGGKVLFRQQVDDLETINNRVVAAHTRRQGRFEADAFVGNLTPWGLGRLLDKSNPGLLKKETSGLRPMWGAFVLHVGVKDSPDWEGTHHQVIVDPGQPLGECNSVFISLSARHDPSRAPAGYRAATISTHTNIQAWDDQFVAGQEAYLEKRREYSQRMLAAAEKVLPGFRSAASLVLPGTPHTFERFTRRPGGMVGGFPQTSLLAVRGPRTHFQNLWLVGDSIFPGQSTAGVTLGAMRTADLINAG